MASKQDNTWIWAGLLFVGGFIVYEEFIKPKPVVVTASGPNGQHLISPVTASNPVQSIVSTLTNLLTGNSRPPVQDLNAVQDVVVTDSSGGYGVFNQNGAIDMELMQYS